MKTRDGYEIKKRCIYYWVLATQTDYFIIKIRCRLFEKLDGTFGVQNQFHPRKIIAMLATNGQHFSGYDTQKFVFRDPESARKHCIKKWEERLYGIKSRIDDIRNTNLKQMEVEV